MESMIKNMPSTRYSAYKDSGIEWVEDVPAHWEVKKFKRVFYEIKKRSNPYLNCGSISFGKVVYKDDEKIPESTKKSYQVVNKGDFLINPLNLNYDLISLRIALSDIDVVVSSGYIVLSNSVQLDKTFYKYFLHRFDVAFMKLLGSGVRQTLNWNDIANCDLIFPPLPEQTAIAAFLDRKTALIDQAIDIKQKQIELLKERRQILIHKAVTRGLNPDVKMKDSGVEWIGEIPEHWDVKPLKYLGQVFPGITGKKGDDFSREYSDGMKPFIPFTNIFRYDVISNEEFQFVKIRDTEKQNKVHKNDLLFLMSSETLEDIGKCSIYLGDEKQLYLNSFCKGFRIKSSSIEPLFVNSLLLSNPYRSYFSVVGRGFTRMNIKQEYVNLLPILIPKIEEQKEIISYLDTVNSKLKLAISIKEKEIEKLKEFKATLINSAVTGKIKVYNDAE